jgi:hypothetical protein
MSAFLKGLAKFLPSLFEMLKLLPTLISNLGAFLKSLWRAVRNCFHRPPRNNCCYDLPGVYKRPDPMLYDQYWLMSQGLSVTWDNPDIQLYDMMGNPASPSDLNPDQDYKVVVRCWNNSYDAGVPILPVYLSYLTFGIGVTSTAIPPLKITTLGAKGTATCPAFADFIWHTPSLAGHYCLQAQLECWDDANPNNNLGQKNVHVGKLASPATFSFAVQNTASVRRRFELQTDMYQLPTLGSCGEQQPPPRVGGRLAESRQRWTRTLSVQGYGKFPVTPAWKVTMSATEFDLEPKETRQIGVSIEPTAGVFSGSQPFNIHGFATSPNGSRRLAGGVTLTVQGT